MSQKKDNLPGFTANALVYNTTNHYSGAGSKRMMNLNVPAFIHNLRVVCCECERVDRPSGLLWICRGSCCEGVTMES
jgi:hypothetical protein